LFLDGTSLVMNFRNALSQRWPQQQKSIAKATKSNISLLTKKTLTPTNGFDKSLGKPIFFIVRATVERQPRLLRHRIGCFGYGAS
jgi:hypothetical protein